MIKTPASIAGMYWNRRSVYAVCSFGATEVHRIPQTVSDSISGSCACRLSVHVSAGRPAFTDILAILDDDLPLGSLSRDGLAATARRSGARQWVLPNGVAFTEPILPGRVLKNCHFIICYRVPKSGSNPV